MARQKLVSKISTKTVIGKIKPTIPGTDADGDPILTYEEKDVMQIVGIVGAIQYGESDNGPFTKFLGTFKGTNLNTGEVFRSGAMFLPNIAANLVEGSFVPGNPLSIAFNVGVVNDPTSATGYVYTATPLMGQDDNTDPIAMLERQIGTKNLAASSETAKSAQAANDAEANESAETQPAKKK